MSFTQARRMAIETLLAVDLDDAYANIYLPKLLNNAKLEPREAAYATELTYGTCRLTGRYDAIVRELTGARSVSEFDAPVRAILRIAIHDMLQLKTPPHAAVDQAVEATRHYVGERATGFVNGVLRAVEDTPLAAWREKIITGKDGISHWYSHPQWLVRELSSALAARERPTTEVVALLHANNQPPLIDLAVRRGDQGALMAEVPFPLRKTPYSPVGLQMKFGNPGRIREVRRGAVAVQDEASQLMALLAAHAPVEGRDTNWLDMCAAPGGKAGLLAAEAAKRGAKLRANDVAAHRVKLIESTLAPLFSDVDITCEDGRMIGNAQPGHYDRILLDAPCTGAGALRRRPEARWRKRASDIKELTGLQRELLESAAKALRPGGILTYVTCSPLVQETLAQVSYAEKRLGLTRVDASGLIDEVSASALGNQPSDGTVQTWPHLHDTDAMFAAVFRKPV